MSSILYLSCHAILESDDLVILRELGHKVFSPGAYWIPETGGAGMRPPMPDLRYDQDLVDEWNKIGAAHPGEDVKNHITKEFADKFDIIIIMHMPQWVEHNWENIKHKRVIWRTIGQSVTSVEQKMKKYFDQGMEIVRYSPMETNIPGFAGQTAFIRFYKDPSEFCNWNGKDERAITISQHMQERDFACNYTFFEEVTRPFNRLLIGPGSEHLPFGTGKIEFEEMKTCLRNNRVYFYTGTHPASYTLNFIEALMTGIPMVCVGPRYGNANYFMNHNLYEIPKLITHGKNGFVSDDPGELRIIIQDLMLNENYAKKISNAGRKLGIHHFDKKMVKAAWGMYLEKGAQG